MSRSAKKDYDHVLAYQQLKFLGQYIFLHLALLWKEGRLSCQDSGNVSAYNARLTLVLKKSWNSIHSKCPLAASWAGGVQAPSECIGFKIMFGMAHWHGAASTSSASILQYHLGRHELPTAAMQDGQSQLPEATLASQSQGFPQWDRLCYLWSCQGFLRAPLIRERLLCPQLWACHHGSSSRRLAMML